MNSTKINNNKLLPVEKMSLLGKKHRNQCFLLEPVHELCSTFLACT